MAPVETGCLFRLLAINKSKIAFQYDVNIK